MSTKKAIFWSIFWVALSLLVNLGVYLAFGSQKALEFFTGYVIEKSLSVDNLFVFLLIFTYFTSSLFQQRRVLHFGVIGVIILRGALILLGRGLCQRFHWIMFTSGCILHSGYQIIFGKERKFNPDGNIVLTFVKKIVPIRESSEEGRFFHRRQGTLFATSLFLVLVIIETTDVVFAVDSIPAIFESRPTLS